MDLLLAPPLMGPQPYQWLNVLCSYINILALDLWPAQKNGYFGRSSALNQDQTAVSDRMHPTVDQSIIFYRTRIICMCA